MVFDRLHGYISLVAHESFHALQGITAEDRLAAAETAVHQDARYPWSDNDLRAAWQTELDLLADALRASSKAETADLARQFLAQRQARRQDANLNDSLIDFEKQREWSEGLARYIELEIWRVAAASDHKPSAAILNDSDFDRYQTFDRRRSQEIGQIGRMATDDGDGRFYYTGMAQAALLDQLLPGWKEQILDEGVFIEDLLETAVRTAR